MKIKYLIGAIFTMAVLLARTTFADIISPSGTFGALPEASFGGSGIPNDAVMVSEFSSGQFNFKIGLTATPRFDNPPVMNDGMGNYFAINGGDTTHGQPGYGLWNFDYYINVTPEIQDADPFSYSVKLFVDKDPAVGNDVSPLILEPLTINGATFDSENSLNLGMVSLFGPGFNPDALGEYGIKLAVYQKSETEPFADELVGTPVALLVNVNETGTPTPDAGSTAALLSAGLMGIGTVRRFMKR